MKQLEASQAEVRRLTDAILDMRKDGFSPQGPQDEAWSPYTTEEADLMRMGASGEVPESHEQTPTTDGGPDSDYALRLELERSAQTALEADLPAWTG